jgi:probable HAF family extracellular repeat protein
VAGDTCNEALSINSQGQIVGFGSADCSNEDHAFLSENGGPLIDLQSLVAPGSGVTLINAIFINDRGEIAAFGKLSNGDEHALVLIPCDEQHHGIEDCDYSLVHATAAAQVHAPQVAQARSGAMQNGIPISLTNRLRSGMTRRYHIPGSVNGSER